jgi:glycosyltransferase involved in cell wall biosynthesis
MTKQQHIKIAAFTSRQDDPASYFRIRQYKELLQQRGLLIQEYSHPAKERCWYPGPLKALPYVRGLFDCRKSDVIWLRRVLVEGYETFERFLKRPRVMDVDDSIWLARPFGKYAVPHIAGGMDAIIAGNEFLANWFSRYCKQVHIVPTAIDLNRYKLSLVKPQSDEFIIGWTGSSSNFKYLGLIEKSIMRFLSSYPDAKIKIIADKQWESDLIPPERIIFVQWSREEEVSGLYDMSVGIMPLSDDQWTAGKCAFKMLQYMAVGLPVVVSPVGMNKEVLAKDEIGYTAESDDQWYNAIETLYKNITLRKKMGLTGRKVVEKYFNTEIVAQTLCSIFSHIVY